MKKIAFALLVIGGITFAMWNLTCPCAQLPGGHLGGEEVDRTVSNWDFVNQTGLCQLQVDTWRPHSINLNCMSDNGTLYVSCSNCASKSWSHTAQERGYGRLRVDGQVYPVSIMRVMGEHELDSAWTARVQKLRPDEIPQQPRPDHWWSFRLASIAK